MPSSFVRVSSFLPYLIMLIAALVPLSGCPTPNTGGSSGPNQTFDPLVVDAGPDVETDPGVPVQLTAGVTGGDLHYFFQWSPATGLDDPSILQPNASPQVTTTYTLTVADSRGVTANDQVTVSTATQLDKFSLWKTGVNLRGANVVQRHVYPDLDGPDFMGPGPLGPPYTQDDFNRLAAAGANFVDLSHTGLFTVSAPYIVDEDAQANMDRLIEMAAQANLFVVISFRSGPGRSEFALFGRDWVPAQYMNDDVWSVPAAQQGWTAMWRHTADRYKDNPIVIGYDLMCEPDATAVLNVWDQNEFTALYAGTTYDWNVLHPMLTAAIRAVDTQTPILVGAENYSNVSWLPHLVPSSDSRTVYAVHSYSPMTYTHQAPPLALQYPGMMPVDEGGPPQMVDAAWLTGQLQPVRDFMARYETPVAINEFGVQRYQPGAADYLNDVLTALEDSGVNHALWLWASSWSPQGDVDDFDLTHGPDPANHQLVPDNPLLQVIQGAWARNTVRAANGR